VLILGKTSTRLTYRPFKMSPHSKNVHLKLLHLRTKSMQFRSAVTPSSACSATRFMFILAGRCKFSPLLCRSCSLDFREKPEGGEGRGAGKLLFCNPISLSCVPAQVRPTVRGGARRGVLCVRRRRHPVRHRERAARKVAEGLCQRHLQVGAK
jgi:hypothetical protein